MEKQLAVADSVIRQYKNDPANLIMILQDIQTKLNYLPQEAIEHVSKSLSLPTSQVHAVATFYKSFSLKPRGRHKIDICEGTACHIRGASILMSQISEQLDLKGGETTADGQYTLNSVHCVGACAMGPVVVIDGEYHGEMTAAKLTKELKQCGTDCKDESTAGKEKFKSSLTGAIKTPEQFKQMQQSLIKKLAPNERRILVCCGTGCLAKGGMKVAEALSRELEFPKTDTRVTLGLKRVGCHGLCEKGPLLIMHPEGIFYAGVTPEDVPEIVKETVMEGKTIDRLLYRSEKDQDSIEQYSEIPFYKGQFKIALRHVGLINPLDIGDYIAHGGYNAFVKTLTSMEPEQIISAVEHSGLRGRGGGGFPAGRKWRTAVSIESSERYVICNGDEGDPGAFMDCSIMEGDPHAVIEGMLICAHAVRSAKGFIYVREEYPRALTHLQLALDQAYAAGLLGNNILGTDFSFAIKIVRGAGAFVCGESTALMQSVQGNVGEPRAKYIRSAERGLYERPTVLNNVETFVNLPVIIENGPEWFSAYGTKESSGTKVFSVVGKVKNTGLVEVPMGTTLRQIIFDICGGIKDNKAFKAVQTGGPSGGCLPGSKLDLPVDFDTLTREGSMMGSGGMIVMDQNTCMVDVARYFTDFLTQESCGKCSACRLGLEQLHSILEQICRGEGQEEDLTRIEKLLHVLENASLCGLGKSAPNPVRSTLKHFREEYMAHIAEKRCPAGVCRALISYEITDLCTGCRRCARQCPQNAISGNKKEKHFIDQELCNRCGLCINLCNFKAILVE
jgi:NADH:ubiquinone oxidoreductase subunit F (NADH-binding)/NADH:ubiquinone oxidoreductase subunit E